MHSRCRDHLVPARVKSSGRAIGLSTPTGAQAWGDVLGHLPMAGCPFAFVGGSSARIFFSPVGASREAKWCP